MGPGTTDYSTTLGLIDLIWDRLDFLLRDTPLFFAGYNCYVYTYQMQPHNVILLVYRDNRPDALAYFSLETTN